MSILPMVNPISIKFVFNSSFSVPSKNVAFINVCHNSLDFKQILFMVLLAKIMYNMVISSKNSFISI